MGGLTAQERDCLKTACAMVIIRQRLTKKRKLEAPLMAQPSVPPPTTTATAAQHVVHMMDLAIKESAAEPLDETRWRSLVDHLIRRLEAWSNDESSHQWIAASVFREDSIAVWKAILNDSQKLSSIVAPMLIATLLESPHPSGKTWSLLETASLVVDSNEILPSLIAHSIPEGIDDLATAYLSGGSDAMMLQVAVSDLVHRFVIRSTSSVG